MPPLRLFHPLRTSVDSAVDGNRFESICCLVRADGHNAISVVPIRHASLSVDAWALILIMIVGGDLWEYAYAHGASLLRLRCALIRLHHGRYLLDRLATRFGTKLT